MALCSFFLVDKGNTHFFSWLDRENLTRGVMLCMWKRESVRGIPLKQVELYFSRKKTVYVGSHFTVKCFISFEQMQLTCRFDLTSHQWRQTVPLNKLEKVGNFHFLARVWFIHVCLCLIFSFFSRHQRSAWHQTTNPWWTTCHYHLSITSWNNKLHFGSTASNMMTLSLNALFMHRRIFLGCFGERKC